MEREPSSCGQQTVWVLALLLPPPALLSFLWCVGDSEDLASPLETAQVQMQVALGSGHQQGEKGHSFNQHCCLPTMIQG